MSSCHSIPECCVMFSGVKLGIGSFVLSGRLSCEVSACRTNALGLEH